uniref:HAT C-terminal dimerisation domain-containing protein n=1 Tax=Amphimedon queenslandica TaxID=400682 RepID=A0A1X7TKY9_AMPQE
PSLSPELKKYCLVEHILPSNVSNLHDTSTIKEIFEAFSCAADLPNAAVFTQKVERWKMKWSLNVGSLTTDPDIIKVFHVFLTLPVSTATAEKSFSCLRRLKTWLRSTMTKSRLTDPALVLSEWTRQKEDKFLRNTYIAKGL